MRPTKFWLMVCFCLVLLDAGCGDEAKQVSGDDGGTWTNDTGAADTYRGADVTVPSTVSVEIISGVVGPGKSDGTQWDGNGSLDSNMIGWVASAAGLPWAKILEQVTGVLFQALDKPDPFGFAEIDRGYGWGERKDFAKIQDNFQPTFEPSPFFTNVVLSRDNLKVTLQDMDLSYDDDIGVVVLNPGQLLQVWQHGGDDWVNTTQQTNGQLLLLRVVVRE